jgi:hypothetical protein
MSALEGIEATETLPVNILMKHIDCMLTRAIIAMLQNMDTDHPGKSIFHGVLNDYSKSLGHRLGYPSK